MRIAPKEDEETVRKRRKVRLKERAYGEEVAMALRCWLPDCKHRETAMLAEMLGSYITRNTTETKGRTHHTQAQPWHPHPTPAWPRTGKSRWGCPRVSPWYCQWAVPDTRFRGAYRKPSHDPKTNHIPTFSVHLRLWNLWYTLMMSVSGTVSVLRLASLIAETVKDSHPKTVHVPWTEVINAFRRFHLRRCRDI